MDKISLPERYLTDITFVSWIENIREIFKENPIDEYFDYLSNDSRIVRYAMAIPLSPHGHFHGWIILINKNHTPSSNCVFYHNTFIIDNYS